MKYPKPLRDARWRLGILVLTMLAACTLQADASTVGSDGGVTLWISYDDSDSSGLDIDDIITVVSSTTGASCLPTDFARASMGAANSVSQCPGGGSSCTGREKVTGDIQRFAEYVWQSTDGATYIRRVYVADEGRSWDTADIRWNMNSAGSSAISGGWKSVGSYLNLRSSARPCIHDVLHHEFGHYFHRLPDRYRSDESNNYYRGRFGNGTIFPVGIEVADPNTVMNSNFPHQFVDGTNASITIEYDPPGSADVDFPPGEVLTPDLLDDADTSNDGPDRAHHGHTMPFAQDEWSFMPDEHAHLSGIHTEGDFTPPALADMPEVDIVFIGDDTPPPGTVLLLDRSGSMSVQTDGIPASQYVQEAGLYLYHTARPDDFVGTYLYNDTVEELFEYDIYDPSNQLPQANFRPAQGLTNIAAAIKRAIDELINEHGESGVNGATIVLMSDGKQTTGPDLWNEVSRANTLGIRISTFSFGDADTTTMQQIATNTSGGSTEVSERTDAFELKLGMAHEFNDIRGYTPVHSFKDRLEETEVIDRFEVYESRFVVPRHSRDLSFYSFLEGGNAALYDLELIDPSGNVFLGQADSIAERGRFNGVKINTPEPGEWTYRIRGTERSDRVLPSDRPFELTAYVRNLTLDATLALGGRLEGGLVQIIGEVSYRYPLTDLKAEVHIFRGGNRLGVIPLFDDGASGGDQHEGDGVFSGLLELAEYGLDQPFDDDRRRDAKTRLDGHFVIGDAARPAPNAHYETGTTVETLNRDYEARGRNPLPFDVWATRTFDFTDLGDDPEQSDLQLIEPEEGLVVQPGADGELLIEVAGVAPIADQIQLSLGQGVSVAVAEVQPLEERVGARIVIVYRVDDEAEAGPRVLRLQVGEQQLRLSEAVIVE